MTFPMKKITIFFLAFWLSLSFVACKQKEKESTQQMLEEMRSAYERADYSTVHILSDSLNIHFATDTIARKEALTLNRQAEYQECKRNLLFADSVLLNISKKIDSLIQPFSKEISSDTQSPEFYIPGLGKSSRPQKPHLLCSTDTLGNLKITSIYVGKSPIRHTAINLMDITTKSQLKTQGISYDGVLNYRFSDLGLYYEFVTYPAEETAKLGEFFIQVQQEGHILQIDLLSGNKIVHSFQTSGKTVKSLSYTAQLQQIFSLRSKMRKEKERAQKRINYLNKKLRESNAIDNSIS